MSGISSASLIDLKAELFRKQEEFKKQKLLNASTNFIKGKKTEKCQKTSIFSRKNAGVSARSQKDLVAKTEEEDLHEKSRRTLEAKSKLYDQITQDANIPDEDGSQLFLVDFQKKVIDKRREQKDNEAEKDESENEFVDSPNNADEEWVEYTDSLGRTRTCMKKDLKTMHKRDKELGIFPVSQTKEEEEFKESSVDAGAKESAAPLSSQQIYCQMLKDKWEKEEDDARAKPAGPVHYENVRFDEIRTHGVGYYQFSKHETKRQEQMDLLNSLRDQTKEERTKRNALKEKRDNLMAARLKKIKDRQRVKMGLPPEPEIEEDPSPDPKIPEENVLIEVKTESVVKSSPPVREWDLGKDKMWESEKNYFKERRNERAAEFAPPSWYFSSDTVSAPKRRIHQEQRYSPPPQKKAAPQKLKKNKINLQGKKNDEGKVTPKIRNDPVVVDLFTIPLPGETPPIIDNNSEPEEKSTLTTEYQQPQPDATPSQMSCLPTLSSDFSAPLQTWGHPAATVNQYNAMYVAAYNNQPQDLYPPNAATTTPSQDTQMSSSFVTQQSVQPEQPKPEILDRRFFKNVESLQSL